MEYLDIYDENGNPIGKETRENVHKNALWHKTVHCWLYDKEGNIYFQIRKDENQLYTTASGHLLTGETVKQAFAREIQEEIGIDVNYEKAEAVNIYKYKADKIKKDGSEFHDRAFSNVYVCEYDGNETNFKFDPNEVLGLAKINAKNTLNLLKTENGNISGELITNEISPKSFDINDFLVMPGETAFEKYKDVLNKVISLTQK